MPDNEHEGGAAELRCDIFASDSKVVLIYPHEDHMAILTT